MRHRRRRRGDRARRRPFVTRRRFLISTLMAMVAGGAASALEEEDAVRYIWPDRPQPRRWPVDGLTLAWIGHTTFFLRLAGTTILTDPAFSSRIGLRFGPFLTVGPRRLVAPPLSMDELPAIDLLLLSHAHMDHLDRPSLSRVAGSPPMILAHDTDEFVQDLGFPHRAELNWRQTAEVAGVKIEALRVKHWGRRYPWDRDRGYNGYLLSKDGLTVLFAGDTAYTDSLAHALAGRRIDVAMIPIGAYNPWIRNHADPEQAWRMFQETGARYLVPMHWRTFRLSDEPVFEPVERLKAAAGPQADRIVLDSIGQTWRLPG